MIDNHIYTGAHITQPKWDICPVCGQEFSSRYGRVVCEECWFEDQPEEDEP